MPEFLSQFPYWSELITAVVSFVVAWFTAWHTSRNEILKDFRVKRIETYDEVIDFIDGLMVTPANIFAPEHPQSAAKVALHVKAYGSREVDSTLKKFLDELEDRRNSFLQDEALLTSKYMPEEEVFDEDGSPLGFQVHPFMEVPEFEQRIEDKKSEHTPSARELDELVAPVLCAIRKSSKSAKD